MRTIILLFEQKLEATLNECRGYGVKTLSIVLVRLASALNKDEASLHKQDLAKASSAEIDGAVDKCVKELGGLHILVNNGINSTHTSHPHVLTLVCDNCL